MSSTCSKLIVFVAFVMAASACGRTPQLASPPQFPHEKHRVLAECAQPDQQNCFSCVTCHDDVTAKARPSRPDAKTCKKCHPKGQQFLDRVAPKIRPPDRLGRSIHFSHEAHLKQPAIGGRCLNCHSGVAKPDSYNFARMSTCMSCHQTDFDAAHCTRCHSQSTLSKLVPTDFFRHGPNWIRGHGPAAARAGKICNQCHAQELCAECHDTSQTMRVELRRPEAIERSFVHRADWITRHPSEARSQPATCQRCHSTSSCSSCHARRGVSATARGSLNPHPPGWVGPATESRTFHGRAAKRNILTCAGCHDQGPATNCIRCHRVGAGAGNPHPSGWTSARSPSASMCRYCHGS